MVCCCVISFFYIKPQLVTYNPFLLFCCVISFFYIKPQLKVLSNNSNSVVLYLSSTSNHNYRVPRYYLNKLCYIFLLHQTTTDMANLGEQEMLCYIFLLHQTTTDAFMRTAPLRLCYIFLLHQTTTRRCFHRNAYLLCYIFLLHQTTTLMSIVPDAV